VTTLPIEIHPGDENARRLWGAVAELANHLAPQGWCLVGGLMVQLHAYEPSPPPATSTCSAMRGRRSLDSVSAGRYGFPMAASVDFTISFDNPDEAGWIVARVLEVPGAISQGRTREEAKENVLDALRTVLTPDEELAGEMPESDREHLRFTAAA
jgi:predicted RNase H-like HicB family nuclease